MHIVIVDRLTRIKLDERNDIVDITFIEEQNNYILRTRNNLEIQINKALYKIRGNKPSYYLFFPKTICDSTLVVSLNTNSVSRCFKFASF